MQVGMYSHMQIRLQYAKTYLWDELPIRHFVHQWVIWKIKIKPLNSFPSLVVSSGKKKTEVTATTIIEIKNHSTQDSRVVPHRGTSWAALRLTAQIGRDAVLSESYGRGYYLVLEARLYVLSFFPSLFSFIHCTLKTPSLQRPALKYSVKIEKRRKSN